MKKRKLPLVAARATPTMAALKLAETGLRRLPGAPAKKERPGPSVPKSALVGAVLAAAGGALYTQRRRAKQALPDDLASTLSAKVPDAVATKAPGLTPSGQRPPEAPPEVEERSPEPIVPPVSNYDADGPVRNSATHVPVAPPNEPDPLDVEAEAAAAAAEAAAIGGEAPQYSSSEEFGELATDPAEIPLLEGGEGESEGLEQAEADLVDEVGRDPGTGPDDRARQIDEAIDALGDPTRGELIDDREDPRGI